MRCNVSTSRLGNVGGCCYDADYGRRPPAHDGCPSERSSIRTLIRTSNRRESRSRDDKHAPAYRCGHNISTNTGCRIQSILSPRKAGCHRSGQPCMVTYLPTGNNTRLKAMAALPLPLYYQAHNLNMTYSTEVRLTAKRRIFHFHLSTNRHLGVLAV